MTEIGRNVPRRRVELPGAGALVLAWGTATDVGLRRAVNEDSFVAQPPVFAVADGMGGHSAGDRASKAVVERLASALTEAAVTTGQIGLALAQASRDIGTITEVSALGAGTTVTGVALARDGSAACFAAFNVGDSRLYRFEDERMTQVSVDHSVVQELVDAGALAPDEAAHHPDSNVITRAIGFNEPPDPDFWLLPARAGLRLLACSDGLTKEVDDRAIEDLLGAGAPARTTALALVEAALAGGGRDNVTAVVVDVLEVEPAR